MNSLRKIEYKTEIDRILNRDFMSGSNNPGFIEVGPNNFCLPTAYQECEEHLSKFFVRDDDVFIAGLPKTGTTWCEEMVWLLVNNLDYEEAKKDLLQRVPRLEHSMVVQSVLINNHSMSDILASPEMFKRSRCIKTHLPWSLLPEQVRNDSKQPKIIYMLRNPKDTCISHYHYLKLLEMYKGTFEDFCKAFLGGRVPYGPFWESVLSYWQERHRPNMLFIEYKEMKKSLPSTIKRVADFLGKTLTDYQIEKLASHLTFANMKNNSAVNHHAVIVLLDKGSDQATDGNSFIRRGEVDGYRSVMSPELIQRFDTWTKGYLAETGLNIE